ncbi:uncharacterized protein LOC131153821 [Malania oleifera]|uniref:uncharacterized protein LOC131153821 n=1 Tax=Malania oleifera TaxID=397392 RepID=UPI0025AD9E48|nr:uncharacterized protein LOC131153821 [Malania oleifera]
MAEIAWSSRKQGGSSMAQGYTIEKFMKMNPRAFLGVANSAVTENWMQEIEKILMVFHCTDEQKAPHGGQQRNTAPVRVYALTLGDAETVGDVVTVQSAKAAKFMHLIQGQMTVSQYAAWFIDLSRFAPHLAPDEKKKAMKFAEGQRQNLFE